MLTLTDVRHAVLSWSPGQVVEQVSTAFTVHAYSVVLALTPVIDLPHTHTHTHTHTI